MRQLKVAAAERRLNFRYKPDDIGQDNIDRICNWYTNDIELMVILRKLNASAGVTQAVNLCDIYTVLMVAYRSGLVRQRRRFLEFELQLSEFSQLYKNWQKNLAAPELIAISPGSRLAKERAIKSIQVRFRESTAAIKVADDANARNVLACARPGIHMGQQAFIIYFDDIPKDAVKYFALEEILDEADLELNRTDKDIDRTDAESILAAQAQDADRMDRLKNDLKSNPAASLALSTGKGNGGRKPPVAVTAPTPEEDPYDITTVTTSSPAASQPGEYKQSSPLPPTPKNPHGVVKRTPPDTFGALTDTEFANTLEAELDPDIQAEAERIAQEEMADAPKQAPGTIGDLFDDDDLE